MRTTTQVEEGEREEVRIMQPCRVEMWLYTKIEYAPHRTLLYHSVRDSGGHPEEPAENQRIDWKALKANLYKERSPYISAKAVER